MVALMLTSCTISAKKMLLSMSMKKRKEELYWPFFFLYIEMLKLITSIDANGAIWVLTNGTTILVSNSAAAISSFLINFHW